MDYWDGRDDKVCERFIRWSEPYDKRINAVDKKKNINNSKFIFIHYMIIIVRWMFGMISFM